MEENTGKKRLIIIIIISIVGVLVLAGLVVALIFILKGRDKKVEPTSEIDMTKFAEYEKRFFGFINPDKSPPLAVELDVHWQKPHPGPFVWGNIEKEKGKYDFTETDKLIRRAQEEGMLTVAVLWPYADWDQAVCRQKLPGSPRKDFPELGDYRQKPCDMEAYKNFIYAVVNRYDGDGPNDMDGLKFPIKYWEVMERPEIEGNEILFSSPSKAQDYGEILRLTSKALKDSLSTSQVLNGGIGDLSPAGADFWRKVLSESKDSVDIIGYNLISKDATENTELTALKSLLQELKIEKPIWVTGVWLGSQEKSEITQERWAEYLVKAYVGSIGNGASKFFYSGLNQTEAVSKNAAMLTCDGQSIDPKKCVRQKTLDAYKTMIKKIEDFDKVEKIKDGQYRFFHDGKATYVIWLGTFPNELIEEIKITDASGNEAIRIASDLTNFNGLLYIEEIRP